MAKSTKKEWSMPARVGVGAAFGYLLLGPIGGVGGAIAGSMYKLERNPGPGFLALGKEFAINFPNGYSVVAKWEGDAAFGRKTSLGTLLPDGSLESDMSSGWGPASFAKYAKKVAKRRKPIRDMVGFGEKSPPKSIKSMGVGVFSKGPNFSMIFENGWSVRVDPNVVGNIKTQSHQYNFAPTAAAYLYTPNGELIESIAQISPVKLAGMLEQVAFFKPSSSPRRREGNKLAPIKGEFVANPKGRDSHRDILKLLKELGFEMIRQKGSHQIFISPTGHTVSVPRKKGSEVMGPIYRKQIEAALQNPSKLKLSEAFLLASLSNSDSGCINSVLESQVKIYKKLEKLGFIEIDSIDGPHLDSNISPGEDIYLYTVCAKVTSRGVEYAKKGGTMRILEDEAIMAVIRMMDEGEDSRKKNPTTTSRRNPMKRPEDMDADDLRRHIRHLRNKMRALKQSVEDGLAEPIEMYDLSEYIGDMEDLLSQKEIVRNVNKNPNRTYNKNPYKGDSKAERMRAAYQKWADKSHSLLEALQSGGMNEVRDAMLDLIDERARLEAKFGTLNQFDVLPGMPERSLKDFAEKSSKDSSRADYEEFVELSEKLRLSKPVKMPRHRGRSLRALVARKRNPANYSEQVAHLSDGMLDSEHKAISSLISRAKKSPDTSKRMVEDLLNILQSINEEKTRRRKSSHPQGRGGARSASPSKLTRLPAGTKIKKLPPGKAKGAEPLTPYAHEHSELYERDGSGRPQYWRRATPLPRGSDGSKGGRPPLFPRPRPKGNRNPKPSPAKSLVAECHRLWEHYCERPGKTRLKAVLKHCELMAESSAKSVKEERARCMRAARREMKKLGMK